ncbi:hypothetical protein BCR32DRAFT_290031 [Anaeromyces robustus]|uniref:Uncharacterized protein n=1 Tax=Anaeromyces robustus TaxID=1754192 RepID=A0A1Y1XLS3_9FUNG|nr:hypothetical protein BCR32DRAFT_290031 [Anaeromyces robustus]|eukprot:ORX86456.1 hypothetical protein BCR32DRAFT_290031 [Anaeromyces robustus]
MNYKLLISYIFYIIFILLIDQNYAISCTNTETFKKCINQVFTNPSDICLNNSCQDIIKEVVVCSEPIYDIYKSSLSLYCAKDNTGNYCPHHHAFSLTINRDDIYQALLGDSLIRNAVKSSCKIEECKNVLFNNLKSLILNSILIGDNHYEDIDNNALYNEFLNICQ